MKSLISKRAKAYKSLKRSKGSTLQNKRKALLKAKKNLCIGKISKAAFNKIATAYKKAKIATEVKKYKTTDAKAKAKKRATASANKSIGKMEKRKCIIS